jgi:MFS family permease
MLARFSEAFLVLRAQDVGIAIGYVPMVMVVMNLLYAMAAYPAGAAADYMSTRTLLVVGLLLLILADILLAYAASVIAVFAGAALWGLHMAFTQGLLSKLIADNTPEALRGTGFGIFGLVTGLALLLASVIAGILWNLFGAQVTFLAGALIAGIALLGLMIATAFHPNSTARERSE